MFQSLCFILPNAFIKGFTIVPLKLYFSKGLAKLEIGVAKGKHTFDKKESIKERDLKRETAFDFSFLLYIPISIATTLLGFKDLLGSNLEIITIFYYLIATIIAGIVTYFATKWFRNVVKNGKLIYFVIYCLIVGTLVILFL